MAVSLYTPLAAQGGYIEVPLKLVQPCVISGLRPMATLFLVVQNFGVEVSLSLQHHLSSSVRSGALPGYSFSWAAITMRMVYNGIFLIKQQIWFSNSYLNYTQLSFNGWFYPNYHADLWGKVQSRQLPEQFEVNSLVQGPTLPLCSPEMGTRNQLLGCKASLLLWLLSATL